MVPRDGLAFSECSVPFPRTKFMMAAQADRPKCAFSARYLWVHSRVGFITPVVMARSMRPMGSTRVPFCLYHFPPRVGDQARGDTERKDGKGGGFAKNIRSNRMIAKPRALATATFCRTNSEAVTPLLQPPPLTS